MPTARTTELLSDVRGRLARRVASATARVRKPAAPGAPAAPAQKRLPQVDNAVYSEFFDILCVEGSMEPALVALTRRLIAENNPGRARSIAQALENYPDLRAAAQISLALCADNEPMPQTAWGLFVQIDIGMIMRYAALEYFKHGFERDPELAGDSLRRALDGEVPFEAEAPIWLGIAEHSFAAGREDLAARVLERAERRLDRLSDPDRASITARIATMRQWLGRANAEPPSVPAGEIPFALVDYKHLDWRWSSQRITDYLETLTVAGHLARHRGVSFTGDDPELAASVEALAPAIRARNGIACDAATVRLYTVDRDFSNYAVLPEGTWAVISNWFVHPLVGNRYDLPLNPALRPIFLSFSIDIHELGKPGAIEYLRTYAPIGCLDWDTVFLLLAAGIPAFFSGALAATVDLVVPPMRRPSGVENLIFDLPARGAGVGRTLRDPGLRDRRLGENLELVADLVSGHQDVGAHVVTSDVRWYVAARALGFPADLRATRPFLGPIVDHNDISPDKLAAIQRTVRDKLEAVLGAVVAGKSADEVYALWRQVCAPDVAAAEAALHDYHGNPQLNFDLAAVCEAIRAEKVVVERTQPGPEGSEINVEFSLDANYTHQMDTVLDSIVERCSRPIRAFVLCRGLGPEYFERMGLLFPTVSFVWLPTDDVSFDPSGKTRGMNQWVSPVAMDRTMLSDILTDVDRIIHFDLDAICLADLAELYDVDMEGMATAAVGEPQPKYASGYDLFRRTARRLRREGRPDLAWDFMIRTHSVHPFDFNSFNNGLMVLDLEKMRVDDFCGRYLPFVQEYGVGSQTVANLYLGRDYKRLDPDWNRLIRLELADTPKVLHWAGPYKPWRAHHYVTGRELWRAQEDRFWARTAHAQAAHAAQVEARAVAAAAAASMPSEAARG